MPVLAIDLGGTKLATAIFLESGELLLKEVAALDGRKGAEVGKLISDQVKKYMASEGYLHAIGISVPGISHSKTGTVWAPNIPGWENYPLVEEIGLCANIPVNMDSDRACCMLGEMWQGNARGC